jgi:hypothetical protein
MAPDEFIVWRCDLGKSSYTTKNTKNTKKIDRVNCGRCSPNG